MNYNSMSTGPTDVFGRELRGDGEKQVLGTELSWSFDEGFPFFVLLLVAREERLDVVGVVGSEQLRVGKLRMGEADFNDVVRVLLRLLKIAHV